MVGWLSRNNNNHSRLYLDWWLFGWVGTTTTIQDYIWDDCWVLSILVQCTVHMFTGLWLAVELSTESHCLLCTVYMFTGLWLVVDMSTESHCCIPCTCLQASGWLLSCLQNPTAVHLYVVPSHTKPGIKDRFLHDLQVKIFKLIFSLFMGNPKPYTMKITF